MACPKHSDGYRGGGIDGPFHRQNARFLVADEHRARKKPLAQQVIRR